MSVDLARATHQAHERFGLRNLDYIFSRPAYTLHYRRDATTEWADEARADYAVFCVRLGTAQTESLLQSDDAQCFNPHRRALVRLQQADALWLTLAPAMVLECALRAGFSNPQSLVMLREEPLRQDARLCHLMRELADELTQQHLGQEAFIAALLEQTMLYLLRHQAHIKRAPEIELSRFGLVDRRIRRAVELLHARLADDVSLEEMAAAAHLSPFHFARLFKKLTGTTPHNYLAALRVAQAQKLLHGTDLSITEIALRVGYASPSHFAKAFRQTVGLTPRDFRAASI